MPRAIAIPASPTCPLAPAAEAIGAAADLLTVAGARAAGRFRRLGAKAVSVILPARTVQDDAHKFKADPRTDEELIVAHRTGDGSALPALIRRYQGELHGFLTRLVGTSAAADDVFQEAFLQVHLSAESFDSDRRFKPWLYTIAANKGRDFLRRQKRRRALSIDAPMGENGDGSMADLLEASPEAPATALEKGDEATLVKTVVEDLPSHFREILLLAYFQKLSYAQIADSLGLPLGTVKSRLHAAVGSFASSWKLACARRGVDAGIPESGTLKPALGRNSAKEQP